MMIKLTIASIVLLGLVGLARMQAADQLQLQQQQQPQQPQVNPLGQANGLLNNLPLNNLPLNNLPLNNLPLNNLPLNNLPLNNLPLNNLPLNNLLGGGAPNGQQYQNGFSQQMQQPGNLLSGFFGRLGGRQQFSTTPNMDNGNGQYNNNSLLSGLSQIPQQGMQMLNNFLASMRNMLPRLGNNMNPNQNQNQNQNQMGMNGGANPLLNNQLMGPGGPLDLSRVQTLTRPLTDALNQGRLPDVNQVTGDLSNRLNGLTRTLSNTVTPAGQQQQQQQPQQQQL